MDTYKTKFSCWQGFPPPQYIYSNMRFKGVALEPPSYEPGSWIGAGKALLDHENREFYLTARPRKVEGGVRGYAANIYKSADGVAFDLVKSLSKEEIIETSKVRIDSIEGTQLLKDPLTGKWHFYISVDTGSEFIWGGVFWETLLLVADDLKGPWESKGLVVRHDRSYDACQARDSSIDIVDGQWSGLFKAYDYEGNQRMQLITSSDGVSWKKHGLLTVDGKEADMFYTSGSIFPGASGPIFLGVSRTASMPDSPVEDIFHDKWKLDFALWDYHFVAYRIDFKGPNLETIFRAPWVARSEFEHEEHPLHNYCSVVHDPFEERVLLYVEAIGRDSKNPTLNESVERVLVFECSL